MIAPFPVMSLLDLVDFRMKYITNNIASIIKCKDIYYTYIGFIVNMHII